MAFKVVVTLLLVKLLLLIVSATEYNHTIYVDPVSGSNTTGCLTDNDSSQPCRNLSYAFQYRNHSTQYLLHPGTHYLNSIASDSPFTDLEEIAIRGNTNMTARVMIVCTRKNSGLLFVNTRNLEIESITFYGCDIIHSNTFGFNVVHPTLLTRAGILLFACSGTRLTSITVTNSGGTGMALFDSTGTINVVNSTFSYNGLSESEYGGGGLYIESSISLPVEYMFQDCTFRGNRGNHNPTESPTALSHRLGGGLTVYLRGSATHHTVKVCGCTFAGNEASKSGGGLCVWFADSALGNSVVVNDSTFEDNLAWDMGGSGGALYIGHYIISHGDDASHGRGGNRVDITHSQFVDNYAHKGGALSISPTLQMSASDDKLLSVYLSSCHFEGNEAQSGAALFIALDPLTVQGRAPTVEIHNSSFFANEINGKNATTGVGAVYINKIPVWFRKEIQFESNRGSAVGVVGAVVDFSDSQVHFLSNVGDRGGAIALLGSARIMVNSMTCMNFSNNLAMVQGGAVYNRYIEKEDMQNYADCFIHHQDPFASPEKWNATFYFDGNRGALGGDAIHSTSILPCVTRGNISEVFRWKGWTYNHNSPSLISSDMGYIEVNSSDSVMVIAGEIFSLPLDITDDLGWDILGETVFTAMSSNDSAAQVDPRFTYVTGKAMKVNGRENSAFTLNLRSTGDRVWHIELPAEVQSCPPGFELEENASEVGQCECSGDFGGRVRCNQNKFKAHLQNAIWMGFSPEQKDTLTVSLCLPGFCHRDLSKPSLLLPNTSSELDAFICGPNHRTGVLCGECEAGYGPAVNSKTYDCVRCNNTNIAANATYYVLSVYVPLFVLFLAIILFNVKLTTGPANAFILYSQVISSTFYLNADGHIPLYLISSQTSIFLKAYRFIYGIFNLEFLDSFLSPLCLGTDLNALDVLQLDYLIAFFPLLMIALVIGLIRLKSHFTCRCFQKPNCLPRSFSIGSSLTHAFTAFLLLSYTNFSLASSYIVNIHLLLGDDGQQVGGRRVYFAGQFSASDTTYLVRYYLPAILVFVIFSALPPFLLLDYPLRLLEAGVNKVSWLRKFYPAIKIRIILDSFQGCFRLNTRFFAGIYFMFRLAINVSYILTDTWLQQFTVQQILCILLILLVALFRPYKKEIFNYIDLLIFTNLTILNLLSLYLFAYAQINPGQQLPVAAFALQGILIFLPLLYMIAYLLWLATSRYHSTIWETLMKQWLISKCIQRVGRSSSNNLNDAQDYQLWDDSFSALGPPGAPTTSVVDIAGRGRDTDIFLSRAQAPNRYRRANSAESQGRDETSEYPSD